MKLTKQEYGEYIKEMCPNSPMWKDLIGAFLIGGLICTVGQAVMNFWTWTGLDQEKAGTATSISMVFLGALLTALSLYDNIAKHAGAGTLVPITGFSNAVVSPAMEFKSEGCPGRGGEDVYHCGTCDRIWCFRIRSLWLDLLDSHVVLTQKA